MSKDKRPELVCLVAPIRSMKLPQLISARREKSEKIPQKGQVLDLDFTDEGSLVDYQIVEFDNEHTLRVQEFYARKHNNLISKEDWSVPCLQRFYSLERLVSLTSQDQETLYSLLSQQPHILLFQSFNTLPCLTYQSYEAVCKCFGLQCESRDVVASAQATLKTLGWLYMQNVCIAPQLINGMTDSATRALLERVGLCISNTGEYSWPYTQRVETKLDALLLSLISGKSVVNTYLKKIATESPYETENNIAGDFSTRLVVLSTGAGFGYHCDIAIELIIETAKRQSTYIDFSKAYTAQDVQQLCEVCRHKHVFLHNTHLISPAALLGVLQNVPRDVDGLVLYYDRNYRSLTSRLLDRFLEANYPEGSCLIAQRIVTRDSWDDLSYGTRSVAYWVGRLNSKTIRDGYGFDFPVTWMSESFLQRFITLYKSVASEAVLLVSSQRDHVTMSHLLPTPAEPTFGQLLKILEDPFGGVVSFETYATEDTVKVTAVTTKITRCHFVTDLAYPIVQYLGELKSQRKYVFYYATHPLTRHFLYKLVSHAGQNLLLNCATEHLSMPVLH